MTTNLKAINNQKWQKIKLRGPPDNQGVKHSQDGWERQRRAAGWKGPGARRQTQPVSQSWVKGPAARQVDCASELGLDERARGKVSDRGS